MGDLKNIKERIADIEPGKLTDEDIKELLAVLKNMRYGEESEPLYEGMRRHLQELARYFKCREDEICIGGLIEIGSSKSLQPYKVVIGDILLEKIENKKTEYQYIIGTVTINKCNNIDMSQLKEARNIILYFSEKVNLTGVKSVDEIFLSSVTYTLFGDIENVRRIYATNIVKGTKFNSIGNADEISLKDIFGNLEFSKVESVNKIIKKGCSEEVKFVHVGEVDSIELDQGGAKFDNIESVNCIWLMGAEKVRFGNISNTVRSFYADESSEIELKCSEIERVEINECEKVKVGGAKRIDMVDIYSSNNVDFPDLKEASAIMLSGNNISLQELEKVFSDVSIKESNNVDLSKLKQARSAYLEGSVVIWNNPKFQQGITQYDSTIKLPPPNSTITGNDIDEATNQVGVPIADKAEEVVNGLVKELQEEAKDTHTT